jgi:hypothetical protein
MFNLIMRSADWDTGQEIPAAAMQGPFFAFPQWRLSPVAKGMGFATLLA